MNAVILTNPTIPVLGSTWTVDLDCTGHAVGPAFLLIFDLPSTGPIIRQGEVLVDLVSGQLLRLFMILHGGGVVTFSVPIPSDLMFCGFMGYSQGAVTGAPGMELSNAVDLVLGE